MPPSRRRGCSRPGSTSSRISWPGRMIVDRSTLPTDRVVFGSRVRVLDLDLNDEEDFILVGPGEEDYDQNKILLTSPIGQGLVGKKVGEIAEVAVPRGTLRLQIVEISVS